MTPGKSALSAVQTGVFTALTGDATLVGLVPGGIWDHVPQDPPWPYVRIGELHEVPRDTSGVQRRKVTVVIHAWSQYRGRAEALAIVDRVIALLRYVELTLVGWVHEHEDTTHDATDADEPMFLEDEGIEVQHASADFTVYVTEA
jgi:hypothetical protein